MPTDSTDWIWSAEHKRYYRIVLDASGQSVSEWAPESTRSDVQQAQPVATPAESDSYANYAVVTETRPRSDSAQYQAEMAPAAPTTISNRLRFRGTPLDGWYDRLDSRYRVRTRREAHEFFRNGRVFAMLWAESASATMVRGGTENTAITIGRFGEEVYSQIRRFVVVKVNRQRHFIYACAISTYGRQGTLKYGCNAAEHTIVHLEGTAPRRLQGEWERGMTKDPIMIQPSDPTEVMEPESRLRCGRIYSIEWNVKLRDIGMVAAHDRTKLQQYFYEEQENGFDLDDNELTSQSQHLQPTQNCYQSNGYYGYEQ